MYKQKCHVNLILLELICISAFEKYSLKSPEYRRILARSTNVPLDTLGTGSEPCQQNIASENTTDITSHLVIMYGFTRPLFICTCQYDRQKKVKNSIAVLNYSILKLYALLFKTLAILHTTNFLFIQHTCFVISTVSCLHSFINSKSLTNFFKTVMENNNANPFNVKLGKTQYYSQVCEQTSGRE